MRLWHTALIEVLPKAQLTGQWREINAIFNEKTNNPIINYVRDYGKEHYYNYCKLVISEFYKRGFKIYSFKRFNDYFGITDESVSNPYNDISIEKIFESKMNKTYLRQCLCNLEEKAMTNQISVAEWDKIWNKFGEEFNLWHPNFKVNTLIEKEKKEDLSWRHSFGEDLKLGEEPDEYEEKEEAIREEMNEEEYIPLPHQRCDRCHFLDDTGFRYVCTNPASINFGKTMRGENGCEEWSSYNGF